MRQQLVAWAGQAHLIQTGSLQLSKELGCLRSFAPPQLSADAATLAAPVTSRARVKLLPVPASRLDLHAQLASPQAQTLLLPRGAAPALHLCLSPCGGWLVVASGRHGRDLDHVLVSAFHAHRLVWTVSVPISEAEEACSLHTAADAFFLVVRGAQDKGHGRDCDQGHRVTVGTLDGVLTASHARVRAAESWVCSAQDACLVGVSRNGDTFYACSAAQGMRAVSLVSPPLPDWLPRPCVSLRGSLAAVRVRHEADHLLWVDMRTMRVQHQRQLAPTEVSSVPGRGMVAAGASSVAVWVPGGAVVSVLASAGPGQGQQLFSHESWAQAQGSLACFDSALGTYLAVVSNDLGLAICHGVSGQLVATWRPPASEVRSSWLLDLHWLPDRAGIVRKTVARSASGSRDMDLWTVLRIAA